MVNYAIAAARVGVLGATGYTGRELLRLVAAHPELGLAFASSESSSRLRVGGRELDLVTADQALELDADLVFCCLPYGRSGVVAAGLAARGVRVVDLSSDHRPPEGAGAYGLPELFRDRVAEATLVANPGCYPTGVLLALVPPLRLDLVRPAATAVVNAASGVTGAGRTPSAELLFGEVAEDYRAYALGNSHRHLPEMRWALERSSATPVSLVFAPHLLPVRRGILETILLPVRAGVSSAEVHAAWQAAYAGEPFVELFAGRPPSLADVVGRNAVCLFACDVAAAGEPAVQVVVALDNLLKGASGQALQNANLMLGLDERLGLPA